MKPTEKSFLTRVRDVMDELPPAEKGWVNSYVIFQGNWRAIRRRNWQLSPMFPTRP